MSMISTETGPVLPPWSLTAASRDSAPAPARSDPPGDTDFGSDDGYMFGADGLDFTDILDIINPLQHVPVVSTLYRALTGDEISPGSRMVGGVIFGGPTGFAAAVVNNAMVDHTGRDVGQTVLAAVLPEDGEPVPDTAVALASAEAETAPAADPPVPPAALTVPSETQSPEPRLAGITGQPPAATPVETRPLIDRRPRPQPFAAGPAAPLAPPRADPPAPAPVPTQVAALPQIGREPAARAPAPPKPLLDAKAGRERESKTAGLVPTPLDPSLIPQAMLSALEKYEQMKRGS